MDEKKLLLKPKRAYTGFISILLSFSLVLSVAFCAASPARAAVSTEHAFQQGMPIYLDATGFENYWSNNYPYMYFFDDNPTPHVKTWVRMTAVDEPNRLMFTGQVPLGTTYYRLIFTSQKSDVGDWNYKDYQTVDITWDGIKNCYALTGIDSSGKMTGYWKESFSYIPKEEGAYSVSTDALWCGITAEAEGKNDGTADAGDQVNITIDLKNGYSLDDLTVTGKSKTNYPVSESGNNLYCFTMPEENVTVSASFLLNKANAFSGNVFWVDTQPEINNSAVGLVKWTNLYGGSGSTSGTYTLYLPGGTNLGNLPVYYGTGAVNIDGINVEPGQYYSFNNGQTYNINGKKMKVMCSESASVYLQTQNNMPVSRINQNGSSDQIAQFKENTRQNNGVFMGADKNGNIINQPQKLTQVKGRGNSSFEASYKYFGKYAYNIKLDKKTDILGMGAVKSKSFCLLANNMDESLLRNYEIYKAAAAAGMKYVPHFETADLYNNGEYLGSYLVTEKVDVGKSKLVQGETVEDYHNDANATGGLSRSYFRYNGGSYQFQYVDTGVIDEGVDYTKKSYLLEFDLQERAQAENCWFVTPMGQYIAVKAPEDVNEQEIRFIIEKWFEAENAVYSGNISSMAQLMDLDSFADVYLIQEFTKNLDSCASSYFVYYDGTQSDPKWLAAPIWDYDWALGGYTSTSKKIIANGDSDANNQLANSSGWFAKYKSIIVSDQNQLNKWNLQAQLCSNSRFWSDYVVKSWNSRIYNALKNMSDSIEADYNMNKGSILMNEARYGFIQSDPISSWGSTDTGDTPDDAFEYLRSWISARLSWMNSRLVVPYSSISISADKTMIPEGGLLSLTAVPYPLNTTGLDYVFSENNSVIEQTDQNTITVTAELPGTYSYSVSANGYSSEPVEVIVLKKVEATKPGCSTQGNKEYYTDGAKYYILKKGEFTEISYEDTIIPKNGHSYGSPSWIWSEENGGYKAELTLKCSGCDDEKTYNAEVSKSTENGIITYSAAITVGDTNYTSTKSVPVVYTVSISDDIVHGSVSADKETVHANSADKTVTLTVTPDNGFSVKSVTFNGSDAEMIDGTHYSFTMPDENVTVDAQFDFSDGTGAILAGYSLSLDGDIGVNFYMELSDEIIGNEQAYMQFSVPADNSEGSTVTKVYVKPSDGRESAATAVLNGRSYYVFKCRVPVKDMTVIIKAQMFDENGACGDEYNYSVEDYAKYLIENAAEMDTASGSTRYTDSVPLVKAMLNFGSYTQEYFGVNTNEPANAILSEEERALGDVTITPPEYDIESIPQGVSFEGATLSLRSVTTLSLYFTGTPGLTFSCEDHEVEVSAVSDYQVARIRGITADELSSSFTVTITAGDAEGSITYSPMNYCYNVLNGGSDGEKLQNVIKSLYKYWQEAYRYLYVDVTDISLDYSNTTVKQYERITLTPTILPDNATDKTVVWESSDSTIASVTDGVVYGRKGGTVTITARAGEKSANCVVVVLPRLTQTINANGSTPKMEIHYYSGETWADLIPRHFPSAVIGGSGDPGNNIIDFGHGLFVAKKNMSYVTSTDPVSSTETYKWIQT